MQILENIELTWRETHRLERNWHYNWLSKRICNLHGNMRHLLGKIWNKHLTSKQLELPYSNKTKDEACQLDRTNIWQRFRSIFVASIALAWSYIGLSYWNDAQVWSLGVANYKPCQSIQMRYMKTFLCKNDREQTNPLDVIPQPHIMHLLEDNPR